MGHLGEGALRRLIDEPLAASEADRRHLEGCTGCRERSGRMGREAEAASALLAVPSFEPETAAALARVRKPGPGPAPALRRAWSRWTWSAPNFSRPLALAGAVVVVLVTALAATPSLYTSTVDKGAVAVPVSGTPPTQEQIAGLPDLSKYGTSKVVTRGTTSAVLTAADATAATGLVPPAPPAAYAGRTVTYTAITKTVVSFTFDQAMATQAAAAAGKKAPVFLTGMDKMTLTVTLGPAVGEVFGTIDRNDPLANLPLVQGVSAGPIVTTTNGITPSQLEAWLVQQPGIADQPDLVAQIKAIGEPLAAGNLVIPIPASMATSSPVSLPHNVAGVEVAAKVGLVRAMVWEQDGKVYAVGGHLDDAQLLALATELDNGIYSHRS